jgi:uncharacterized membrane protein HdeD (DUF308 family)
MSDISTPPGLGSALAILRPKWGWFIALGVGLILCGLVALYTIVIATVVSVIWVGCMMIVAGAIHVVHGFQTKAWGRSILWTVLGAIYVFGGFFAIVNPLLASLVLTLVLAWALIVAGIMRIVLGFHFRGGSHAGWIMFSGLLTFLFGLIILVHWPFSSLYALGIILGVDLLQSGVGWLNLGMVLKRGHKA